MAARACAAVAGTPPAGPRTPARQDDPLGSLLIEGGNRAPGRVLPPPPDRAAQGAGPARGAELRAHLGDTAPPPSAQPPPRGRGGFSAAGAVGSAAPPSCGGGVRGESALLRGGV